MDSDTAITIGVVIVNFNGGDMLHTCLAHLSRQTRKPDRILVVDNGSEDNSLAGLEQEESLEILALGENLGFAAANNRAFAAMGELDYVVTLNPDAYPAQDFIAQLERAAIEHPEAASLACRMMRDEHTVDGAGDVYHCSGLVWRHRHGCPLESADTVPREAFSPCAGAAMYQLREVSAAGGFDENFFCYVEDIDLGFRLRLLGKRCIYVPEAVVTHLGSGISGRYSGFAAYHGQRNLVWALCKNMPIGLLLPLLPVHLLMTLVLAPVFAWRGELLTYGRAKRDALRGLGRVMRQRRGIQAARVISCRELIGLLDWRLLPPRRSARQPTG